MEHRDQAQVKKFFLLWLKFEFLLAAGFRDGGRHSVDRIGVGLVNVVLIKGKL